MGLHYIECELFVAPPVNAAAPSQLEFRVDYRIEGNRYPALNIRQPLAAPVVVAKSGMTMARKTATALGCRRRGSFKGRVAVAWWGLLLRWS